MGRAATVHIRAGEGDGALPACLARGLGVEFMTTKLQVKCRGHSPADVDNSRGYVR